MTPDRRLVRSRIVFSLLWLARVVFPILIGFSAEAQSGANYFPGIEGSVGKLHFHTGRVANNQPEMSSSLPDIPGPTSPWSLIQWSQPQVISPTSLRSNDPATRDGRLGVAKYAFSAADGHSHMWIYEDPHSRHPIYELYERGGALTAAGGANVFLSSDAPPGGISLDHELDYEVDARLSKAVVKASLDAQRKGTVLAQVFTGFVIQFPEQDGKTTSTLFLQLPIARSIPSLNEYRSCTSNKERRTIILGALPRTASSLPFEATGGPLKHLRYNINSYICDLIARPTTCSDSAGHKTSWSVPTDVTRFQDWKIQKMYIGLETESQDLRPQSPNKDPQGEVEVAFQLGNLRVASDPRQVFDRASCVVSMPAGTRPQ